VGEGCGGRGELHRYQQPRTHR